MIPGVIENRYRLVRLLGEGGMAKVFLGHDHKLDRPVAVKILHAYMRQNEDIARRFQVEAQAISRLDHPNVVKIFDYSGTDSPLIWLVTEYIRGGNLAQFLESNQLRKLDGPTAAVVILELCRAVMAAHDQGIIHRDIKPENIMINESGNLKLMDFGIAKRTHRPDMTQVGTFMGSPSYMSPEQVSGGEIDPRSDLFSICILYYELVSGVMPFSGATASEVASKILSGKFIAPSRLGAEVEPDVEALIIAGLSLRPEDRPASVRQFAQILEEILKSRGINNSRLALERYVMALAKQQAQKSQLDTGRRAPNQDSSSTQTVASDVLAPALARTTKVSRDNQQVASSLQMAHVVAVHGKQQVANLSPEVKSERKRATQLVVKAQGIIAPRNASQMQATYRVHRAAQASRPGASMAWGITIALSIILVTLLCQQIYVKLANRSISRAIQPISSPTVESSNKSVSSGELDENRDSSSVSTIRAMEVITLNPGKSMTTVPRSLSTPSRDSVRGGTVIAGERSLGTASAGKITLHIPVEQPAQQKAPIASPDRNRPTKKVELGRIAIESTSTGLRVQLQRVGENTRRNLVTTAPKQILTIEPGQYQLRIARGGQSMSKKIVIEKGEPLVKILVDF